MKTIAVPPFHQARCLNLNTIHPGWIDEIPGLLEELVDALDRNPIAIPRPLLEKRLSGIRYFGLVDPDAIRLSRDIVIPYPKEDEPSDSTEQDTESKEQAPKDPLESMLCALADTPWHDNRENCRPERGDDDWDEHASKPDRERCPRRPSFDPSSAPTQGTIGDKKRARGSSGIRIVVDCYGIYVENVCSWAKSAGAGSIAELRRRIEAGDLPDGPAVLLCPENICDIPGIIAERARPEMIRALRPGPGSLRQFLRLVLYHEIGHHVFPLGPPAKRTLNLSEAMANWFAYRHVSPEDRCALHLLSETQDRPYRMYQGMIPLLHPESAPTAFAMGLGGPFPFFGGLNNRSAWEIERIAFGSEPAMAATSLPLLLACDWDGPFLHEFLHFGPRRALRRAGGGLRIHPAEIMGAILLRDVLGAEGRGVERAVEMFRSAISPRLHALPGIRQLAWQRRAWAQPAPEPRVFWPDLDPEDR